MRRYRNSCLRISRNSSIHNRRNFMRSWLRNERDALASWLRNSVRSSLRRFQPFGSIRRRNPVGRRSPVDRSMRHLGRLVGLRLCKLRSCQNS